ncbi:SSI family serine proteinase inhibitor [Streptomyces sp. Je 1-369]|uniref:SSI family serine proteinase inhibitor n=1 Tax=Streptomyces sp. Je 1-369 TaxID=2966192 RepID=UPI0022855A91|nr:SSI family serine proteinase inhibitor [Streptomyces sp. Je 1-369]WAL96523.1 subtilase-type protease inhibitor [Streptomyces sp. Je 1-369]
MLRRLVLTAAASVAALSAVPAAAHATADATVVAPPSSPSDRLTVKVTGAGGAGDGTYELKCHPTGGTHPDAAKACERLQEVTVWGTDPFAPVPKDSMCTMQYGGPATAHVTGTWQGRPVDATYDRSNGCEISRWDGLVPVLPATSA